MKLGEDEAQRHPESRAVFDPGVRGGEGSAKRLLVNVISSREPPKPLINGPDNAET